MKINAAWIAALALVAASAMAEETVAPAAASATAPVSPAAAPAATDGAASAVPAALDASKPPVAGDPKSPEVIKAVMEDLAVKAIQVASGPLQTADTFQPYGVLEKSNGELQFVHWGKDNPPSPNEVFRQITLTIRAAVARNPDIIAAATVAPTAVKRTDGKGMVTIIRTEVDHRYGSPQLVLIPYGHENGKLVLGNTIYQPGTNPLFLREGSPLVAPATDADKKAAPAASTAPARKPATKSAAKPAKK